MSSQVNEAPFDLAPIGGRKGLAALIHCIVSAGDRARLIFEQGDISIREKADHSPVTVADEAVERRIVDYLVEHHSHCGILGEEGAMIKGDGRFQFVIDPIDGTRAFMRGIPTWSVLVGLEEEGVPVVGIAYLPGTSDLCVAVRGEGTFCNGKPCYVSNTQTLAKSAVSHGALQQFEAGGRLSMLPLLAHETHTQRGFADFAGYHQLLLGRVDAVIDPAIAPWDVSAVSILVEEAGGTFSDFHGVRTTRGEGAVATNGWVHNEMLDLIKRAHR